MSSQVSTPAPPGGAGAVGRPSAPRLRYMPAVDGLRALAVGAVVTYHAGAHWLPGGFLGVDVFLVISGYLITSLLLAEFQGSGRIDLMRFWLRRARRLLPAVIVMIGVVLAAMCILHPGEVAGLRGDVVAALFYVINWYQIVVDQSYFAQFARPSVFQHLWSLAVEEQFYLLWPPLLGALLVALGRRRLFIAVMVALAISTIEAWALWKPFVDPSRIYYGTDTRAAGLLVGVAMAFVWPAPRRGRAEPRKSRPALELVGVAALVGLLALMATVGEFDRFLYQGGFLVTAVVTALLLASLVHPGSRLGAVFALPPIVWLGVRSYGIYLWHWPILMLTRPDQDVPFSGPPLVILQLGLTVGIAALSYTYVEMPIRTLGVKGVIQRLRERGEAGKRRRMAASGIALAALVVSILVAVLPASTPTIPGIPASASSAEGPQAVRPDPAIAPGTRGPATAPAAKGRVLAVGDSVMLGASNALTAAVGKRISIDAVVARQFDATAAALVADAKVVKPSAVVIHVGTNGYVPFKGLEALLNDLKSVPVVVLVTVRADRPWETSVNDALHYAAEHHKNVVLADWHAATEGRSDLLVDGVHGNTEGQKLYARTIKKALLGARPPAAADTSTSAG